MRADQKFYTIIVLSIVGLFLFYWNVFLPSLNVYVQVVNDILQSSNLNEQEQEIEMEIKEIEERNSYFTQQIDRFKSQFITLYPPSDFYHIITSLAEKSNLKILSLSPTTMGIDTTSEAQRFQLHFLAGFLAIMNFIAQLEEQGILIQLTELSLAKNRIDQSWIEGRLVLSIHRLD